jgi:hypothetical protein
MLFRFHLQILQRQRDVMKINKTVFDTDAFEAFVDGAFMGFCNYTSFEKAQSFIQHVKFRSMLFLFSVCASTNWNL